MKGRLVMGKQINPKGKPSRSNRTKSKGLFKGKDIVKK